MACDGDDRFARWLARAARRVNACGVFSTCLHCHASLGRNDSNEHFPVGQRLAFDGERGRLWAICPICQQWKLAPIEERWEALEACEKAYRAAVQRVSTDNIALARPKDGTDLVRIGKPLLPEFAAWRYGGQYLARYQRQLRLAYGSGAVMTAAYAAKWVLGAATPIGALAGITALTAAMQWGHIAVLARRRWLPRRILHTEAHGPRAVTYLDAKATRVRIDEAGHISVALWSRPVVPAPAPLRRIGVRHVWTGGARSESVHSAHEAPQLLAPLLGASHVEDRLGRTQIDEAVNVMVEHVQRAAEVMLHEDDERRALAGELGALYARWEAAERIARIADGERTRLAGTHTLEPAE